VGYWARALGQVDRGVAVVEVLDRPEGCLVTAEPDGYDITELADLPIVDI
jgi:hypothetical protein